MIEAKQIRTAVSFTDSLKTTDSLPTTFSPMVSLKHVPFFYYIQLRCSLFSASADHTSINFTHLRFIDDDE